ncbi:MAG: hypothetical protein CMJ52_07855 [Planctomycetaceae bacterium]|mgnify:CR=1 FL=1|nr:hypothetical protein [Planctomycetaceae bacterium]
MEGRDPTSVEPMSGSGTDHINRISKIPPPVIPGDPFVATNQESRPLSPVFVGRLAIGGILMGLANLVPGISGGTMLLAAGVYPAFVESVAAATTLARRIRPWLVLGCVGIPAIVAIGLLAGTIRDGVLEHRWIAYSLFIGLTLGGAPTLLRMLRPMPASAMIAAVVAFAGMVALALAQETQPGTTEAGGGLGGLFVAGFAGASAMVLPGVSGGYLLLVLGQYVAVLDAIDAFKNALRGGELSAMVEAAWPLAAIGIGVVLGIVLVSNVVRWLLERHRAVTLGVLLGLLLGAVAGLWPFRAAVLPELGSVIQGRTIVTQADAEAVELKYRPTEVYAPSSARVFGAVGLALGGGFASIMLGRFGRDGDAEDSTGEPSTAQ